MSTEKSNLCDNACDGVNEVNAKGVNKFLRTLKGLRPGGELHFLTTKELEDRFRDYDQNPLGVYHHHRQLRSGIEITCIFVHFPEMLLIESRRSKLPKEMSPAEFLESRRESRGWFDAIYTIEKQRANFDCDRAHWMANEHGKFLLFFPKESE